MACCRCNRSGRCQNCLCVKSGRLCQGCLPQWLGNCVNTVRTPPSLATNIAPLSQNSTPGSSSSPPFSSNTPPCSSPELMESTENQFATPSTCTSITRVPETPPYSVASEFSLDLPAFAPATEPTFTWGSCDSESFINSLNAAYDEIVH